jgi:alanine racemase
MKKDLQEMASLARPELRGNGEHTGVRRSVAPPSIPPMRAEVDLDAVVANARDVQALVGPSRGVLAVLKADAYGHGLVPVARALQRDGTIAALVVSSVRDGLALRKEGIELPIIALACRFGHKHGAVLDAGITPVLASRADLEAFSRAARARGSRVGVHVEIDTGMSRSGLRDEDVEPFLLALANHSEIIVAGLCTHLASADTNATSAHRQLDAFERICARFRAAGHQPSMVHAANTAATFRLPRSHFTHVRAGIALFGGDEPSGAVLRPAMRLTTHVVQLRSVAQGETVSYGETWRATRPAQIATLPVGYAHGYPRRLVGPAEVLVRGRRCPVVGSICMEMMMVDVTDVGVEIDDEVVLIGADGGAEIRITELARAMGGIVEEILCLIPKSAVPNYLSSPAASEESAELDSAPTSVRPVS